MTAPGARPNILLLIPHDLGDFLGCCGHATVSSPNIDRLAAEGIRFSNCFTTSPECSPSRGSLMTGLYPHQNGLMGLANFGWSLHVPYLAAQLCRQGYATHQFGTQHETHEAATVLGYQHVHNEGSNRAETVCANIAAFLNSSDARDHAPWFACAGFSHVHRPWVRQTHFDPSAIGVPPWLPDHPVVRRDLARFHQDIADMDAAVGAALDTLTSRGLDRNTLVIFTTDHGAALPGAKATLYDPGLRVPLILRWPGHIRGGTAYESLLSNVDVAPTLLELAGAAVPDGLAGRSFLPLLRGQPYAPRSHVAGALFYDVAYDPMHFVRTATHKYIRSFAASERDAAGADPETLTTFTAGRWIRVDDFDVLTSPSWQALADELNCDRPASEELYDLRADLCERTNLAEEPAAQNILASMRQRMRSMMEQSESPLLRGHVPPPPRQRDGARRHCPGGPLFKEHVIKRRALL